MTHDFLSELLPTDFRVSVCRLILRFVSDGGLGDEGAASAVRNGIGCGLKRVSDCTESADCPCPYCRYFKPQPPPGTAGGISPAFVLEADGFPKRPRVGDAARLNLLMLGEACQALPSFVCGLLHCGEVGIGSPRARFAVNPQGEPVELAMEDIQRQAEALLGVRECAIHFVSPCILEDVGRRRDDITFPRLVKAVVERLQPNVGYWCGAAMRNKDRDAIAAPLMEKASGIEAEFTFEGRVREVSKGFGGKQDSLSGFTGVLRARGDLDPFWPLLIAGSLVHVGLRPHLDRGRYALRPIIGQEEVELCFTS